MANTTANRPTVGAESDELPSILCFTMPRGYDPALGVTTDKHGEMEGHNPIRSSLRQISPEPRLDSEDNKTLFSR
jgi:hypothetical protein